MAGLGTTYRRVSGDQRPATWGRAKMLALLTCGLLAAAGVVVGFVFAIINATHHPHNYNGPSATTTLPATGVGGSDAPMRPPTSGIGTNARHLTTDQSAVGQAAAERARQMRASEDVLAARRMAPRTLSLTRSPPCSKRCHCSSNPVSAAAASPAPAGQQPISVTSSVAAAPSIC